MLLKLIIMFLLFLFVLVNTYFFISNYIFIVIDFVGFPILLTISVLTGLYLIYSLVTKLFHRCTEPFRRFKLRQSIVFKKFFKDILDSCMGTLWRVYEFHVGEDLEICASQQKSLDDSSECEILDMSPKEEESIVTREQNARLRRLHHQAQLQLQLPIAPQFGQLHANPHHPQHVQNIHPNAIIYPNHYLFNFPYPLPSPPPIQQERYQQN